jgi:hypothetical protein
MMPRVLIGQMMLNIQDFLLDMIKGIGIGKERVFIQRQHILLLSHRCRFHMLLSYGPPWARYLGGYQDRLLGGPLGLLGLSHTASDGVGCNDYGGEVLG